MPIIDNPGGGDCGFYAIAIGLLVEIQKQYTQTNTSPLFDVWVQQGLSGVSLDQLLALNVQNLGAETRPLLNTLQMSLRTIAVAEYKRIVAKAIGDENFNNEAFPNGPGGGWVKSTAVYGQFMQLVEGALRGEELAIQSNQAHDDWRRYNILISSTEVVGLALRLAKELEPELQEHVYWGVDDRLKSEANRTIEELRHKAVKAIFLKHQSTIILGIDKLKEKGVWANDEDLRVLAPVFDVNLVIPIPNGCPGVVLPDIPTLTLVNRGNGHWVTSFSEKELELINRKKKHGVPVHPLTHSMLPEHKGPNSSDTSASKGNQALASPGVESSNGAVDEEQLDRILDATTKRFHSSADYKTGLRFFIQNLVFGNKEKISVADLDKAQAKGVESGAQTETDEEFAIRLQEAEFRKMGL